MSLKVAASSLPKSWLLTSGSFSSTQPSSSDTRRKYCQEWGRFTLAVSDEPSTTLQGHLLTAAGTEGVGPCGNKPAPGTGLSPLNYLPQGPQTLPAPSLSAAYLLGSSCLLQAVGMGLTCLLQLCPTAFQLPALLHDVLCLGVPRGHEALAGTQNLLYPPMVCSHLGL